jgi:hypothetical protein
VLKVSLPNDAYFRIRAVEKLLIYELKFLMRYVAKI